MLFGADRPKIAADAEAHCLSNATSQVFTLLLSGKAAIGVATDCFKHFDFNAEGNGWIWMVVVAHYGAPV